ncbi:hypothetical protein F511_20607 [Dorcoceras hygrometricum]|uniref:Uncharacterized protein n=1 Tax=Dorcoceras hygrometricum TaxID=472368 RepID=A0A2Z7A5F9_9LAMI|nr:hypothetical protein F511_20607 [Dorcoceras hygrometricum]
MGKEIKIPGVDERTWYLASLPQIQVNVKGKELLVEKDPVKGNPVKEQIVLTLADIACLVQLREKVIDEEELVLTWAEAESTGVALNRKRYILLKYREMLLRKFLEARRINFAPGKELLVEKDPVKGNPVKEQIVLTLADIACLVQLREKVIDEVAQFFYSFSLKRLSNLKIDESYLAKEELVLTWAEAESTSVALNRKRLSSRLSIEDITDFVASIASARTALRNVQIIQTSGSISSSVQSSFASAVSSHIPSFAKRVPKELDQRPFFSSTSSAPDMHFDETDIAATLPSLPALSTDLSVIFFPSFTQFKKASVTLQQQEEAFRTLIQGARQEGLTIDDVQTLRFNEFRKGVLANSASVTADLMDIKKAVRELNAKVDAVSTRLDDVKKDVEATKEAISHQLLDFQAQAQANHNIITGQLRELVNYINRGGTDKKGKVEAEDLNHHLMIKTETVAMQVVILLEALWKDLLVLIEKEKGAEGTEVDPTKEEDTRIE